MLREVQRTLELITRANILEQRQRFLNDTIVNVKEQQQSILKHQKIDEDEISKNRIRSLNNLDKIHKNTKKIAQVNDRLTTEIKNRIQGDKDTLKKAKHYTDQQVKKAAHEPWYDQVLDFFKNLPKQLKELLQWIKKLIPIIVGVFAIVLVIYLVKTFGFNPCKPCITYSIIRQAINAARQEARKKGITLKEVDRERLKIDIIDAYQRGDITSGRYWNYYNKQSSSNIHDIPMSLISTVNPPNQTVGLLSAQPAQTLTSTPVKIILWIQLIFFTSLIIFLVTLLSFAWVYLQKKHEWLVASITAVFVIALIMSFIQLYQVIRLFLARKRQREETVV